MNLDALLSRILDTVDADAYLTPSSHLDERHKQAMQKIEASIQKPSFDPDGTRALIHALAAEGQIDRVMMLSALHVVACHPRVADWVEAARIVGEQEFAALELGGPRLRENLASVDRHRGVLAYLRRHYEVALDYFTRALERERTAENITNVLCTLLRLGETEEAKQLLHQVRTAFPPPLVREINHGICTDPDLTPLTMEVPP